MHFVSAVINHEESNTMSNEEGKEPTQSVPQSQDEDTEALKEETDHEAEADVYEEEENGGEEVGEEDGEEDDDDEKEDNVEDEDEEDEDDDEDEDEDEEETKRKLKEAEAKAIADATASANASYVPPPSLMSDPSPQELLKSVDGASLIGYSQIPSVYTARSVPVPLRGKLDVPIHITCGGSVVEYTVESEGYDISFGIMAEREEGSTVVSKTTRVDAHIQSITGKFLVGSVPCALIFTFDNEYSWFREKKITYSITVTPPTIDNIIAGRKKRAESALKVVLEEKNDANTKLESVSTMRAALAEKVERLEKELEEDRKNLGEIEKEEDLLKTKVELRSIQENLLEKRLNEGWTDEEKNGCNEEEEDDVGDEV